MSVFEEWGDYRGLRARGIVLAGGSGIYIGIPKVACTSIKAALAGVLGLHGDVHFEIEWQSVESERIAADWPDAFVFAFVRNPWDRLVSCFRSKIVPGWHDPDAGYRDGVEFNFWKYGDAFRGDMTFREFVEATCSIPDDDADMHFGSQYRHLFVGERQVVHFVGRFESLLKDWVSVCDRLGLGDVALPYLNRTQGEHYSCYYDSRTRDLVEERWARDLELLGYRFESAR